MAENDNIGTLLRNFRLMDPSMKARYAGFLPGDTSGNVIWEYMLTMLDGPEDEEDDWDDEYEIVATA